MAITTIKTYPKNITVGVSKINGLGNLLVEMEDIKDGNSYTHKMYFICGEYSYESGYFSTNNSVMAEYAFPIEWANAITNGSSRTGTFKMETYKRFGLIPTTLVETNTRTVTFLVPDRIKPTMPDISIERIDGNVPSEWGIYVQDYSKCRITAAAQGAYSSTIKNYRFAVNGAVLSNQTGGVYTYPCYLSGSLTFTVTATDSRGRTVSKTASITVEKYDRPMINEVSCFRCTQDGTENDKGTYAAGKVNYSFSALSGKNTAVCKASYKTETMAAWSDEVTMSNNVQAVLFGDLSDNVSYKIKFKVADSLASAEYVYELSTSFVLMDFLQGGKGIAFGKVAELANTMDVNMLLLLRNGLKAGEQTFPLKDTGWTDLKLTEGITPGAKGLTPRSRRLGNSVNIVGDVQGITAGGKIICTLPNDLRPQYRIFTICAANDTNLVRWSVFPDGRVVLDWCFNLETKAYKYNLTSYTLNINYLI